MGRQIKCIFMCLILAILAGCSGGQTTAQLEVSTASITTGSLAGGFMVIGENAAGRKFSVAVAGTNQTKIKLEAGVWKFAAVGWDGGPTAKPFEGTSYCGGLSDFNLSEQNATINLDISSTNCSSPLLTNIQFKPSFKILGCDIFYSYDSAIDSFSPLAADHSISFCDKTEMIADYVTKFENYRITALSIASATDIKPAFTSVCKAMRTDIMALPTGKFPFMVSLYKNEADCMNMRGAQTYNFYYGFSDGNAIFDSLLSPGTQSLLLATANTKRGKSPFMTEIPRINCGSYPNLTDCMAEPAPSAHINVGFNRHHHDEQILLKNINPLINVCPATILSDSKFFDTDSCEVEDRSVRIKPYRNEFMCQSSAQEFAYFQAQTISDIHLKGNRVYFLKNDGTNTFVAFYTDKGKFIDEFNIGPLSGGYALKMAVSADGSKMVLANSAKIFFYTLAGSGYTPAGSATMTVQDLEINATGTFLYTLISGSVQARSLSTPNTVLSTLTLTNPITDLKFRNGYLYVLENSPLNPDFIHKAPATDGAIGATSPVMGAAANFEFFEVTPKKLVVFSTTNYHMKDLTTGVESTHISHTGSGISTPFAGTVIKDRVLLASSSKIRMIEFEGTTNDAVLTGNCSETVTVAYGGVTKALVIESKEDQPLDMLFRDGLDFLGRRFFADIDKPFYYFQNLAHNDERTTGGELRRVQEMLSPQALGGFLPEYQTCSDVVAAAPFIKNAVYRDETTGETMGFTLKVSKSTEAMSDFNCASDIGLCPASPNNLYDLQIEFEKTTGDMERMKLKLKCGKEIGSFESFESESGRIGRELYVYYTENDNSARYEKYSFDIEDQKRAEVVKVYKEDAETVKARKIQVSVDMSLYKQASVLEFTRTSTHLFENRFDINTPVPNFLDSNATIIFPYSGITFNDARDNYEMYANVESMLAKTCTTVGNANPNGTHVANCNFTTFDPSPLSMGSGLTLRPREYDIENPTHIMSTGVFEIP